MIFIKHTFTKFLLTAFVFLILTLAMSSTAYAAEKTDYNFESMLGLTQDFDIQDMITPEVDEDTEEASQVKSNSCWWGGIRAYVISKKTIDSVPLYNQLDYPKTPYGGYGTVASHGCGITSVAMVASYLNDTMYYPDKLARQFGNYNTENGSYWILMEDSAEVLGLSLQERTYSTKRVMEALANGQVIIALQGKGLFTGGGHFIVLTGLNEEGKILVNDPNGANYYKNKTLINGFENGFTPNQVFENGGPYWIYDKKIEQKDRPFFSIGILNREFCLTPWSMVN